MTVKPGEVRRVRLISRLAPNLPDGEYRAVVFNETLTESKDAAGNKITLVARIGVTFYVRKGNLSPQLAIDSASFNLEQKQIQILIRNSGQATVLPSLNWTLRQGQTIVKTGQIDTNAVVANSDRNFLLNYPNKDQPALNPGQYQLSGELFWGEENNKSKLPFNVNITIPAQTSTSQKK